MSRCIHKTMLNVKEEFTVGIYNIFNNIKIKGQSNIFNEVCIGQMSKQYHHNKNELHLNVSMNEIQKFSIICNI